MLYKIIAVSLITTAVISGCSTDSQQEAALTKYHDTKVSLLPSQEKAFANNREVRYESPCGILESDLSSSNKIQITEDELSALDYVSELLPEAELAVYHTVAKADEELRTTFGPKKSRAGEIIIVIRKDTVTPSAILEAQRKIDNSSRVISIVSSGVDDCSRYDLSGEDQTKGMVYPYNSEYPNFYLSTPPLLVREPQTLRTLEDKFEVHIPEYWGGFSFTDYKGGKPLWEASLLKGYPEENEEIQKIKEELQEVGVPVLESNHLRLERDRIENATIKTFKRLHQDIRIARYNYDPEKDLFTFRVESKIKDRPSYIDTLEKVRSEFPEYGVDIFYGQVDMAF